MKAKITLTYAVEVIVEATNEDTIYEFANEVSPMEACELAEKCNTNIVEMYDNEIVMLDDKANYENTNFYL